jgi:hypothetical protein
VAIAANAKTVHMKGHDITHSKFESASARLPASIPWLAALLLIALAALCVTAGGAAAKEKTLAWKPIEDALLRVDDAPVKDWGVYQAGKKSDRLLMQMGKRFLVIELRDQQIYEVDPAKVQQKSGDLLWNPDDHAAQPLATSEWSTNDIGGAFGISAKLDAENHVMDLQLPHPPDLRDLPQRSSAPSRRQNY